MKYANALLTTWTAPVDTCSVLDVFSAFDSSFDTKWHSCISRKDKREGEERSRGAQRREGGRGRGEDGVQEEEKGEGQRKEGGKKIESRRRKKRVRQIRMKRWSKREKRDRKG